MQARDTLNHLVPILWRHLCKSPNRILGKLDQKHQSLVYPLWSWGQIENEMANFSFQFHYNLFFFKLRLAAFFIKLDNWYFPLFILLLGSCWMEFWLVENFLDITFWGTFSGPSLAILRTAYSFSWTSSVCVYSTFDFFLVSFSLRAGWLSCPRYLMYSLEMRGNTFCTDP